MKGYEASPERILAAAKALRDGGLVVMPTETVYGLAANALDTAAVSKIFAIKRRPADNPLIVHISRLEQLPLLSMDLSPEAQRLVGAFWPGPLTLILSKSEAVPEQVTAGKPSVAVRMPSHPVAASLIEASGCPLAAPSANTFMRLSPTKIEDVEEEILNSVDAALDGGPCEFGLESTIVDCCSGTPKILRPGAVSREHIENVIGQLGDAAGSARIAPGMYARHYAPVTKAQLVEKLEGRPGLGFLIESENQLQMPGNAESYGATLYAALHQLDRLNLETIFIERPPLTSEWEAVWDRLTKATTAISSL